MRFLLPLMLDVSECESVLFPYYGHVLFFFSHRFWGSWQTFGRYVVLLKFFVVVVVCFLFVLLVRNDNSHICTIIARLNCQKQISLTWFTINIYTDFFIFIFFFSLCWLQIPKFPILENICWCWVQIILFSIIFVVKKLKA